MEEKSVTTNAKVQERWRLDYNRVRPHRALGNLSPEEFVETIT